MIVLNIPEPQVICIFSLLEYLLHKHFNFVTVRLWSDFEVSLFDAWHLLGGSAYYRTALILISIK